MKTAKIDIKMKGISISGTDAKASFSLELPEDIVYDIYQDYESEKKGKPIPEVCELNYLIEAARNISRLNFIDSLKRENIKISFPSDFLDSQKSTKD
ncbi:MAG: hypothetical protein LKF48_09705 [Prevotella sp.]|jgi:hypothetical protein|nr:hypothetical protein [Prevotella sp.]MCH4183415.1 hypothetical protein [Prevotella sp.]